MALKAKIKFKSSGADGDDDVIVIKVKRENWVSFSQLLGAARENAYNGWDITESAAQKIEEKFDEVKNNN